MPRALTKEEFQNKINNLFKNEKITILKYTNASSPMSYRCDNCGTEFTIHAAKSLYRKQHCCNNCFCGKGKGETTIANQKIALQIIKENNLDFIKFGYNSKLLKHTIQVRCKHCDQIFEKQLSFFVNGNYHCSYCETGKKMNSIGFQSRISKEYTLLEDYKGADNKVLFRHEKCGFIWRTTPHNIISGCGCPKCAKSVSKGEKRIK